MRAAGLRMLNGFNFIMIAVGVYAAQVGWRLRRRGLRPLDGELQGPITAVVRDYASAAGLRKTPHVYHDLRPLASPSAFGKSGQPILVLNHDCLVDFRKNRGRFDAVIHHELYHFRSNDVRTYYRALAFFRTLALVAAVYIAIFAFGFVTVMNDPVSAALMIVQGVLIIGLGLSSLRDYLRRREYAADIWAVDRTGSSHGMKSLLTAGGHKASGALGSVLRSHPSVKERLAALNDRRLALTFTPSAAFLAAVAVGLLVPSVALFLPFLGFHWVTEHVDGVAGAIGGLALGRILGIGIWRNVHVDMLSGRRIRLGFGCGLGAAAGLIAGGYLPLPLVFQRTGPAIPWASIPWVILIIALPLLSVWMGICARLRLSAHREAVDAHAYRWGLRFASLATAELLALTYFTSGLIRGNRVIADQISGLPHLGPERLPSESQVVNAYLHSLTHDRHAYAAAGVLVLAPVAALIVGVFPPSAHLRYVEPPPVPSAGGHPIDETGPIGTTEYAPLTTQPPSLLPTAQETAVAVADPPVLADQSIDARLGILWAVITSVAVLAALPMVLLGVNGERLFVLTDCAAVAVLAGMAFLGRRVPVPLLVLAYAATATAGALATLPAHHYQAFSLIAFGLAGTAVYAAVGLPFPGERHAWTLLVAGLLLHHNFWILLGLIPLGLVCGAILRKFQGERIAVEPLMWLGFAVAGVLCAVAETLVA